MKTLSPEEGASYSLWTSPGTPASGFSPEWLSSNNVFCLRAANLFSFLHLMVIDWQRWEPIPGQVRSLQTLLLGLLFSNKWEKSIIVIVLWTPWGYKLSTADVMVTGDDYHWSKITPSVVVGGPETFIRLFLQAVSELSCSQNEAIISHGHNTPRGAAPQWFIEKWEEGETLQPRWKETQLGDLGARQQQQLEELTHTKIVKTKSKPFWYLTLFVLVFQAPAWLLIKSHVELSRDRMPSLWMSVVQGERCQHSKQKIT